MCVCECVYMYIYNKSFIGKAPSCAGSSLCSDKYGPE